MMFIFSLVSTIFMISCPYSSYKQSGTGTFVKGTASTLVKYIGEINSEHFTTIHVHDCTILAYIYNLKGFFLKIW